MQLRNPFVMIVMAFGVGCSELPPSERRERRDEAAVDTEPHQERRLISPEPISEQGDGGTGGEGERPQFD